MEQSSSYPQRKAYKRRQSCCSVLYKSCKSPTIIFINKIDRAGVNLERLYMDIKTNLSQDVLFMQTVVDGSVYPVCSQTYIKGRIQRICMQP